MQTRDIYCCEFTPAVCPVRQENLCSFSYFHAGNTVLMCIFIKAILCLKITACKALVGHGPEAGI